MSKLDSNSIGAEGPATGPSAFFILFKKMKLKIITASSICFILFNSFLPLQKGKMPNLRKEIPTLISLAKDEFEQSCDDFISELKQSPLDKDSIDFKYKKARVAYKKIELYFSYYDPDIVKKKLNGAPLSFIEENAPDANIINPVGLQVIDERLSEHNFGPETVKYVTDFKKDVIKNTQFLPVWNISDRNILELYRINIIKILALEISGFETPGSSYGIIDSRTTLSEINSLLKLELARLSISKQLANRAKKAIKNSEDYLAKSSTEKTQFDHFVFIRDHLQKLYEICGEIHEKSGVEYADEVFPHPKAINWKTNRLFSHELLNKRYYSQVLEENEELIELGRLLFYEPLLSHNNERSCASCHNPSKGFSDGLKTSEALNRNGHIKRNSPSIANAIYATEYFSDLRAERIVQQVEHVIFSPDEFGSSYTEIENKIESCKDYVAKFQKLFGDRVGNSIISKSNISTALAAFVQHQSSWNSDFDKAISNEENNLTLEAKKGFNLFMGKGQCGTCHFAPIFSGLAAPWFDDSESENLGITASFDTINPVLDTDLGKGRSSKIKERLNIYAGHFKTPSIRNAGITGPYMHHGGFLSLEEVISFYNVGGGLGMGLNAEGQTLAPNKLELTSQEQEHIKAFILSLTDTAGLDLAPPSSLPNSSNKSYNKRKVGGTY